MSKPKLVGKPKNTNITFSDRKLEVLRTAARLFNRKGFHNTTMDDIEAVLSVTNLRCTATLRAKMSCCTMLLSLLSLTHKAQLVS